MIIEAKNIKEEKFEPFTVNIQFENTRDVLRFLKEVYDIENKRMDGDKFESSELEILKRIEAAVINVSGEESWCDRKRKDSKKR